MILTIQRNLSALFSTALISLSLLLSGCDQFKNEPVAKTTEPETAKLNGEAILSSANLYAYTQMSEALNQAQLLDGIITSFLHHPNPLSLEETQTAWVNAYQAFLEVSYFHGIPRFEKPQYQNEDDTYTILHEQLDSWPIEAGYIDYLPMYPLSGIINDMTLTITLPSMIAQHGFSDALFASLGYHPMEFILFGADGKRSARDFIPQENSMEVVDIDTAKTENPDEVTAEQLAELENAEHDHDHESPVGPQNHNRRRDYLRLLSAHIVQSLQKITDRWEPAHGYYAKQWRQPQQMENLTLIFQVLVETIQVDILDRHLRSLLTEKNAETLRSPFAKKDMQNIKAVLTGVEKLLMAENGFVDEIRARQADVADKITAQFKRLLLDVTSLKESLPDSSLEQRKKVLDITHQKIVDLLESLYLGAQVLDIELATLPVSTT